MSDPDVVVVVGDGDPTVAVALVHLAVPRGLDHDQCPGGDVGEPAGSGGEA